MGSGPAGGGQAAGEQRKAEGGYTGVRRGPNIGPGVPGKVVSGWI